jgi:hypothetical protein
MDRPLAGGCSRFSKAQRAARRSTLIICLSVLLAGCRLPEIETCSIFPRKDIVLNEYGRYSIVDGAHTAFEYYHEVPDPPCASDIGEKEILVFQVDPAVREFTLADADFVEHVTTYRLSAFSPYSGDHPVSSGIVSGVEVSPLEWSVQIDVVIELKGLHGEISPETRELHLRREFQVRR